MSLKFTFFFLNKMSLKFTIDYTINQWKLFHFFETVLHPPNQVLRCDSYTTLNGHENNQKCLLKLILLIIKSSYFHTI